LVPGRTQPVVCRYKKNTDVGTFSWNQDKIVVLDTSVYESDIHLGAIGWDSGGVSVLLISLDSLG
jgi:hypothetical protein